MPPISSRRPAPGICGRQVASCQPVHRQLQSAERAGDVAIDQPGDKQSDDKDRTARQSEPPQGCAERRVQIVGIGAREEVHLPRREPRHRHGLPLRYRLARLREHVAEDRIVFRAERLEFQIDQAAAGGRVRRGSPAFQGLVDAVDIGDTGRRLRHHIADAVVEMDRVDGVAELFHGLVLRQAAVGDLNLQCGGDAAHAVDDSPHLFNPIVKHPLVHQNGRRGDGHGQCERYGADQHNKLGANPEVAEEAHCIPGSFRQVGRSRLP